MSARTVLTAVGRRSVDRRETCKVARNKSLPHTSARLPPLPSQLARLECSRPTCRYVGDYRTRHNLCPNCQAPLLARYHLDRARETLTREVLRERPNTMWRYEEVLPDAPPVTLGEGMTPLIRARRLGAQLGLDRLYIKDEGQNPTSSFKARGLSAAVSMAKALRVDTIALPTAGNAGGAAAAYAAQAGLKCVVGDAVGYAGRERARNPRLRCRRQADRRAHSTAGRSSLSKPHSTAGTKYRR